MTLLALLIIFSNTSFGAQYQPSFEPEILVQRDPVTRPIPRDGIREIRVLVFPHLGRYSIPQGAEKRVDSVTLESKGTCKLFSDHSESPLTEGTTFTFEARELTYDLFLQCSDATTLRRENGLKSFSYHGDFQIHPAIGPGGKAIVQVVNIIPFETYLKGVVPSEVPATWPMEAIKAQAVAARTYAIFEVLGAPAGRIYHVDDTVQYQAYLGASSETASTNQAVEKTAGEVLTFQGEIIKAYFSADSGGYTEAAHEVFEIELPYCVSKAEVYDPTSVKSEWEIKKAKSDVASKLFSAGLISSPGISRLWLNDSERTPSGRARVIYAQTPDGAISEISAFNFRHSLGLRSTLFSVSELTAEILRFQGRGWGHGVGMSQEGSFALAKRHGWNYARILSFYYNDTVLGGLPFGTAPGQ